MTYIIIILLLINSAVQTQQKSADEILNTIKEKMNLVEDYEVNVEIAVDMDFLKMPKSKAKLYYKKPDKFKFHSSSFAILPKAGIDFNPQRILDRGYNSEILRDKNNQKYLKIRITPDSDTSLFQYADLEIHREDLLLSSLKLIGENESRVTTVFSYSDLKEFALPSQLDINFQFEESLTKGKGRRNIPEKFKGDIIIKYLDYKINQGLSDDLFIEEFDSTKSK